MYEARDGRCFWIGRKSLSQPVFDRLHIVVGARLDGFDRFGVVDRKVACQIIQVFDRVSRQRCDVCQLRRRGDRFQPLNFDFYAVADQAELAEIVGKRSDLAVIAPIKR